MSTKTQVRQLWESLRQLSELLPPHFSLIMAKLAAADTADVIAFRDLHRRLTTLADTELSERLEASEVTLDWAITTKGNTMIEFDVTPLFSDKLDAYMLSNSVANLGERAAEITWDNALGAANEYPLVNDGNREEVIDHVKTYGAWEYDDLLQFDNLSLGALVWQFAAGDFREHWEPLQDSEGCFEEGTQPEASSIYQCDGKFLFHFGA